MGRVQKYNSAVESLISTEEERIADLIRRAEWFMPGHELSFVNLDRCDAVVKFDREANFDLAVLVDDPAFRVTAMTENREPDSSGFVGSYRVCFKRAPPE